MRSAQPALDGLVDADLPDGCPREFRKVCRCPRVRPTPPAPLLTRRSGLRVLDQEASIARNLSADTRRPGAKPSRPSAAATGAPGVQPIEERGLRSVCGGRLGWGDRCGTDPCLDAATRRRRVRGTSRIPQPLAKTTTPTENRGSGFPLEDLQEGFLALSPDRNVVFLSGPDSPSVARMHILRPLLICLRRFLRRGFRCSRVRSACNFHLCHPAPLGRGSRGRREVAVSTALELLARRLRPPRWMRWPPQAA